MMVVSCECPITLKQRSRHERLTLPRGPPHQTVPNDDP